MSERTRDFLKTEFRDGERPSGADFADLIDSFVNKAVDGVTFDGDNNLVLVRGVRLGDSNGTAPGGLRFNSNQLQLFVGGAWTNVSGGGGGGGGGAFQPSAGTPTAVSHNGNVGIGTFPAAGPTYRLEVPLGPNSTNSPADQVRIGNAVIANGSGIAAAAAVFSHQANATNTNFALRQSANGTVQINAPTGQSISIRQGGGSARFGVSGTGNVIVNGDSELPGAGAAVFQVGGSAFKNDGSAAWATTSDARVKDEVRDLELGLSELRQVRPVRFRYNGRGGTPAGTAGVGVLGQEIETVIPETIRRVGPGDSQERGLEELRVFDASALTYVLINAVKELATKVEELERALAQAPATAPAP